jgi:hypothetical protein
MSLTQYLLAKLLTICVFNDQNFGEGVGWVSKVVRDLGTNSKLDNLVLKK